MSDRAFWLWVAIIYVLIVFAHEPLVEELMR